MPNYCYFDMEVQGNFRNVDAFVRIMNNNYDKLHMYRIFEAIPSDYRDYGFMRKVHISGYCAWSIMSCMLADNPLLDYTFTPPELTPIHQYIPYSSLFSTFGNGYFARDLEYTFKESGLLNNFKGCTITQLARYYKLEITIYGTESGMEFSELYKINRHGAILINKSEDYEEYFVEDPQQSFDEYCEDCGLDKNTLPFGEKEYQEAVSAGEDLIYKEDHGMEDEFYKADFRFPKRRMFNKIMMEDTNNKEDK